MFARARTRALGWSTFAKFALFSMLTMMSVSLLRIPSAMNAARAPLTRFFARPAPAKPSAFEMEAAMSPGDLVNRWTPYMTEASHKFAVPVSWIRAVMQRESGGRTMMAQNAPITSSVGAEGLMQVMPDTYAEMRVQCHLGADANDPHDNIIAGTAYIGWLYKRYGFPRLFAAYNDGPGNFDKHVAGKRGLPAETVAYLAAITANVAPPKPHHKTRLATAHDRWKLAADAA